MTYSFGELFSVYQNHLRYPYIKNLSWKYLSSKSRKRAKKGHLRDFGLDYLSKSIFK